MFNWILIFNSLIFQKNYRRRAHQVLENDITRRTLCAVVVDVHRITFKNHNAPNVDIQLLRFVLVSIFPMYGEKTHIHTPTHTHIHLAYVFEDAITYLDWFMSQATSGTLNWRFWEDYFPIYTGIALVQIFYIQFSNNKIIFWKPI